MTAIALGLFVRPAHADEDPWFGRDKALHFGATFVIAGGGYGIGALAGMEGYTPRLILGGSLGLGAGLGKEAIDLAGYGDPSYKDLVWDVAGTAVGLGLSALIDFGVHHRDHAPSPPGAASAR